MLAEVRAGPAAQDAARGRGSGAVWEDWVGTKGAEARSLLPERVGKEAVTTARVRAVMEADTPAEASSVAQRALGG